MGKNALSLTKCVINISSASTSILQRQARHDRYLEVGSVNIELALNRYENVREAANAETKLCTGAIIGMKANVYGSVFVDLPFILNAHDATRPVLPSW